MNEFGHDVPLVSRSGDRLIPEWQGVQNKPPALGWRGNGCRGDGGQARSPTADEPVIGSGSLRMTIINRVFLNMTFLSNIVNIVLSGMGESSAQLVLGGC
jgi:hypothetical protein